MSAESVKFTFAGRRAHETPLLAHALKTRDFAGLRVHLQHGVQFILAVVGAAQHEHVAVVHGLPVVRARGQRVRSRPVGALGIVVERELRELGGHHRSAVQREPGARAGVERVDFAGRTFGVPTAGDEHLVDG